MPEMIDLVSGGVGAPQLALESDPETTKILLPVLASGGMKEVFEKVYDGDNTNINDKMLEEELIILGFRYSVNIKIPRLTPEQVRSIQELLNAREPLRFTPHEDCSSVHYKVYLKGNYSPRWVGNYITDAISLDLSFKGLDLIQTVPYNEVSPGGDTEQEWDFDREGVEEDDLTPVIFNGETEYELPVPDGLTEDFEPVYTEKQLSNGSMRIYLRGWRYKVYLKYDKIERSLFSTFRTLFNLQHELGFTPRIRDWDDAHYTVRYDKAFGIEYKDQLIGYKGDIALIGQELLDDIDFYPAHEFAVISPNGGEVWQVPEQHNITFTAIDENVNIWLSRNNGTNWSLLTPMGGVSGSSGYWNWTVSGPASTECLIKVANLAGTIQDQSDAVFTIVVPS